MQAAGVAYEALARELSRRAFLARASSLGVGALVASALPAVERLAGPLAAHDAGAAVALDAATLQAFADTMIPGRKAERTDLGDEIHPDAIAGVDPDPGAVEADALRLYEGRLTGFGTLAPVFLADLSARALAVGGGPFLSLPFERRVAVALDGLSFANPTRAAWEAAAAVPFVAFCAAGAQLLATDETASGYRYMRYPGTAPRGYPRSFSYRRRLNRGVTANGSLP
jgi:hypothetical protein